MNAPKPLQQIWDLVGKYHPDALVSDDEMETALRQVKLRRKTHSRIRVWPWISAAAVILVAVMIGLNQRPTPVVISTAYGEITSHLLPDGSIIELNSGTTMRYDADGFGTRHRDLQLDGEAFITAKTDESLPMRVMTHNATVSVYGTEFNVRSWPGDPSESTVVMLLEGQVGFVANQFPEAEMRLEPGFFSQVTVLKPAPSAPEPIPADQIGSWRSKGFHFTMEPMTSVLAELERRYSVTIIVSDPWILNRSVSLSLTGPVEIGEILNSLSTRLDISYKWNESGSVTLFEARRQSLKPRSLLK